MKTNKRWLGRFEIFLLLTSGEVRLARFYDLRCTGVYEGISERLAMKIGNENQPQWIRSRHWERMAEELGIRPNLSCGP